MHRLTPLWLLLFFLTTSTLYSQVRDASLHTIHPNAINNAGRNVNPVFNPQNLNDPFIELGCKLVNISSYNYFAITNGVPAVETKIAIPETPEKILEYYILEFRRCNYPFTIIRLADNTYSFTGTVNNEVKKILLTYDPSKQVTFCNYSCETSNHELLDQRKITLERFPELERLPGEVVYFKEYHQGPIISICIKLEFRGNTELAMNEISNRLTQYGWKTDSTRIANHQNFSKTGASARISAMENRHSTTAMIVISDQSQILSH